MSATGEQEHGSKGPGAGEGLNACPFCGGIEGKAVSLDGAHYIRCSSCHATGPYSDNRGLAGVLWNGRVRPPAA